MIRRFPLLLFTQEWILSRSWPGAASAPGTATTAAAKATSVVEYNQRERSRKLTLPLLLERGRRYLLLGGMSRNAYRPNWGSNGRASERRSGRDGCRFLLLTETS